MSTTQLAILLGLRAGARLLGVLIALLTCYVGCLVWMRRITATPRQPRILVADGGR